MVWVYIVGACCKQLIRLVGMVLVGFYFLSLECSCRLKWGYGGALK